MSDRRSFLRGLAALPLIGGGVTLIGNPTAAAVLLTLEMLNAYNQWLFYERRLLLVEQFGLKGSKDAEGFIPMTGAVSNFISLRVGRAGPRSRSPRCWRL